jgi:hypothetical protein
MKLRPLAMVVSSIGPAYSGELLSPSLPNSVSERKKPASLAGFLYLRLNLAPPTPLFLSPGACFTPVSFSKLVSQTPSSF